jgi:DNA-binding transcriptional LysR family regulator
VNAAADALGISQGSVITVVHRLEKRLGLAVRRHENGTA